MTLNIFNTANLFEAVANLFQQLGIRLNSNTAEPLPVKDLLKQHYKDNDTFKTIGKAYFIGIIDNTVFQATGMFDVNYSYKEALQQGDKNYDGLMLFALELSKQPIRSEISDFTRTFNRISQKMPVALVLKYQAGNEVCFSIAISERFKYKQNWRQGEKAGKVIILRDIHTETTHAGHERILLDLVKPVGVNNYDQLHQHWLQVLDVNILNKKFFQDLANWYFWAMENVSFPDDMEKKKDIRNATNLIRLITRVVFIWFIKEKKLVPNSLFDGDYLTKILKDFNKNKKSQNYYHAILQNLFFGTLNQKMEERKFAKDGGNIKINGEEYGVKNLFRYADLFNISEKEAMQLFKDVPFLNGGLFDCLDKPNEEGKIIYVDGFSRNPKKQASVPDYIFFGEERDVDLNNIYATKNKKYKSRGLINLLESYKFTVAENTPIEEEIALDPELLGKVFENLLASYNPETQTTARKQTGSFYTPREIVNYMVDESLLEYIKQNVKNESEDFETRLRELISYVETPNPFDEKETKALIEGINNCKILDPACGSGAYPMGILHKMVHLLQKLDPENKHWKALQRQKAMEETEATFKIGDKEERGKRLNEINDVFENNASDYGRKLYLIENCIYGIDIQPIAVQISKLRFFISLIIDQNKQATKENFGIRSLPNLETKFVAANTLIGLNKPAQTLLRNPKIEEKENELKELRHKYFTANTRKEKLQYQKRDKKLRQEIAKMLESDGWQTAVAKQIVAFDPYDQNKFAPWFDPEWMFGKDVEKGFDVVIGNPPYVVKLDEGDIKYFQKEYKTIQGKKYDLFRFFIEKSILLNSKNGVLTFIVPDVILNLKQASKLRKFILDNCSVNHVIKTPLTTFTASVESIIIQFKKGNNKDNQAKLIDFESLETISTVAQNVWYNNSDINFDFEDIKNNNKIINKIKTFPLTISSVSSWKKGLGVYSRQHLLNKFSPKEVEKIMTERPWTKDFKADKTFGKEILGKDVNRYSIKWNGIKWLSYGPWLAFQRPIEYFKGPRLLVREITLGGTYNVAATYEEDTYYNNQSIFNGIIKSGNKYELKFLLSLINSRLFSYYVLATSPKSDRTLFPTILMETIELFPLVEINTNNQKAFVSLVDYILLLNKEVKDSSFFEHLIDAMVYELYFPEEIKEGGAEVLKQLSNLPKLKEGQDEPNLKTIEKVYKELSDPKHPISAALLRLLTIEEINIIEGRK